MVLSCPYNSIATEYEIRKYLKDAAKFTSMRSIQLFRMEDLNVFGWTIRVLLAPLMMPAGDAKLNIGGCR